MKLTIPEMSLIVLIGPSGAGKSTFARKHFRPTEIVSSDFCRALIADDENQQGISAEAFELLHFIVAKRLAAGRLTVIDATSVKPEDRAPLVQLARAHHCLPVAIVFDLPEKVCQERNRLRPDRDFGPHVIRSQRSALRRGLRGLQREGFRYVHRIESEAEADAAAIEHTPLWNNRRHDHGPFDIIGDVHGCFDELAELLTRLGYQLGEAARADGLPLTVTPPPGRKAVFLGDLVDRGPATPRVLKLVMGMCADGAALCVPGNHDMKLMRKLRGRDVQVTHGLAESLAQLDAETPEFRAAVAEFLDRLISHYVLDDGRLVVAHAGMKAEMQGRGSARVREFALFGETSGETDEFGLPVRCNWAADYRGRATVVYGHTPVPQPEWLNHTINIDTGCVFGGALTALRYPERELVRVPARRVYAESRKPFLGAEQAAAGSSRDGPAAPAELSAQQAHDQTLHIADLLGKRHITTRLSRSVSISAGQSAAALEVMSRFAVDPRWLIYLPPTMSPCETSERPDVLEHPREAFAYFRNQAQPRVICQEKHMGSRAVVILCRDPAAARKRFGIDTGERGLIYTRTGRRFFADDRPHEEQLLDRLHAALSASDFWSRHQTDWLCLDCELMPWSAKAQGLLRDQYAAVGAAARHALPEAADALATSAKAGVPGVAEMLEKTLERGVLTERYVHAYQRYCWPVESVADLKLAPFHLLATQSGTHFHRDHAWHMETIAELCAADPQVLLATACRVVDLTQPEEEAAATAWWEELTAAGGEGMVVKPLDFIARSAWGVIQPAVKCRGREYLRLIYGPEYTRPEYLDRLRRRGLKRKRDLALQEFVLGVEGLERFTRAEPLRRVHECVFGVLALESEPVDPRL